MSLVTKKQFFKKKEREKKKFKLSILELCVDFLGKLNKLNKKK